MLHIFVCRIGKCKVVQTEPSSEMEKKLREWHRVVQVNGIISIAHIVLYSTLCNLSATL